MNDTVQWICGTRNVRYYIFGVVELRRQFKLLQENECKVYICMPSYSSSLSTDAAAATGRLEDATGRRGTCSWVWAASAASIHSE